MYSARVRRLYFLNFSDTHLWSVPPASKTEIDVLMFPLSRQTLFAVSIVEVVNMKPSPTISKEQKQPEGKVDQERFPATFRNWQAGGRIDGW